MWRMNELISGDRFVGDPMQREAVKTFKAKF